MNEADSQSQTFPVPSPPIPINSDSRRRSRRVKKSMINRNEYVYEDTTAMDSPRKHQRIKVPHQTVGFEESVVQQHDDKSPLIKLNCLICWDSYLSSNAFSVKNQFTPSYSTQVLKVFCQILQIPYVYEVQDLISSYETGQFPLPFCNGCSEQVIGLTQLQEELEALQESLAFAASDIKVQIHNTKLGRHYSTFGKGRTDEHRDELIQKYESIIEVLRNNALRDFVPHVFPSATLTGHFEHEKERKHKRTISKRNIGSTSSRTDLDNHDLGSEMAGRKEEHEPKATNIPPELVSIKVEVEPSSFEACLDDQDNFKEHDYGRAGFDISEEISDPLEITEVINEGRQSSPSLCTEVFNEDEDITNQISAKKTIMKRQPQSGKRNDEAGGDSDPKFRRLVKELGARTREILRKKQLGMKSRYKPLQVNVYNRVPITTDSEGRLFCGSVAIYKEEVEGEIYLKCGQCGYSQQKLIRMKRHIKLSHNNGQPGLFECGICGKKLKNGGSLPRHLRIYHSSKERRLFECDICSKKLKSARSLKSHRALVHSQGMEQFVLCDICVRPFRDAKTMKMHRLSHMNEEERQLALLELSKSDKPEIVLFSCPFCGKSCVSEAALRTHEMIHTDVTPFICDTCGWGFRHKCNLQAHLQTHLGDQRKFKFECDEPGCGRKFSTRLQLVQHSYCHRPDEEKPFKCSQCGAAFVRTHDLSLHRRKHTGEKPYTCVLCMKSFTRSYHLSRHSKNVHNVSTATIITAEIVDPSLINLELAITENENGTFTAIV